MQSITSLSTPWFSDKTNAFKQLIFEQPVFQSKIRVKFSP
jgi:hypothetical protein